MKPTRENLPPIIVGKEYDSPSAFTPENLLREARRQKHPEVGSVPEICVLDPDGDIVRHLQATGRARRDPFGACYHTDLYVFAEGEQQLGIIGSAIGAAFAVLVAEELFASGCELLLSVTSAGQILPVQPPPYFISIDRALRDEGTSYHYLPPADFSEVNRELIGLAEKALAGSLPIRVGATWTTDAPFRETQTAIDSARTMGVLAVEMEAAALYAFAQVRGKQVLCFAHVTNQMAQIEGDFEKGFADGAEASLRVISLTAKAWRRRSE